LKSSHFYSKWHNAHCPQTNFMYKKNNTMCKFIFVTVTFVAQNPDPYFLGYDVNCKKAATSYHLFVKFHISKLYLLSLCRILKSILTRLFRLHLLPDLTHWLLSATDSNIFVRLTGLSWITITNFFASDWILIQHDFWISSERK
jgi:hypothetical protein